MYHNLVEDLISYSKVKKTAFNKKFTQTDIKNNKQNLMHSSQKNHIFFV